jgi:cephalosporin hydroxylase
MSIDVAALAKTAVDHQAMQKPEELAEFLGLLIDLKPRIIVEIGSGYGGTLYAWCGVAPKVIAIDVNTALIQGLHGATMINKDSRDPAALSTLLGVLAGRMIDCLFIDGAHTYDCAMGDYRTYRTWVRKGGLIAFHDIATFGLGDPPCEVPQVWSEVKDGSAREIIHPAGGDWGGIGVLTA